MLITKLYSLTLSKINRFDNFVLFYGFIVLKQVLRYRACQMGAT